MIASTNIENWAISPPKPKSRGGRNYVSQHSLHLEARKPTAPVLGGLIFESWSAGAMRG